MKNVLIVQTAFLGDVILATALAESLRKDFPGARISMLVREGNESLLKGHPFLEQVFVWRKRSGKLSSLRQIISEVRSKKFDAVINLQRFFSSGLITALSGAPVKSGFDKNPLSFLFSHQVIHIIGDGRHETERNFELLRAVGGVSYEKPRLYPSAEDDLKTKPYKETGYVTMAPASVWFTKQLPENKWVDLIKKIETGKNIYLIGGPGDAELCERIIRSAGKNEVKNLAGKLSLLQTASLMRDAAMNYVNDSGPLHIASAMNAPVTAFFCSTIPAFGFGPLSDQSRILQVRENLTCRPCGLHGKKACPLGHFKCGNDILIEP